jgi:hypothetical protein
VVITGAPKTRAAATGSFVDLRCRDALGLADLFMGWIGELSALTSPSLLDLVGRVGLLTMIYPYSEDALRSEECRNCKPWVIGCPETFKRTI